VYWLDANPWFATKSDKGQGQIPMPACAIYRRTSTPEVAESAFTNLRDARLPGLLRQEIYP
jgi:hypothetical protein